MVIWKIVAARSGASSQGHEWACMMSKTSEAMTMTADSPAQHTCQPNGRFMIKLAFQISLNFTEAIKRSPLRIKVMQKDCRDNSMHMQKFVNIVAMGR